MKVDADYWKGFWAGRAIAVRLAGLKAEPQWYLYNGVRLPKLPEWDKTKYPYAMMWQQYGSYGLRVTDVPQAANLAGASYWGSYTANAKLLSFSYESGVWTGGSKEYTGKVGANNGNLGKDGFVWANHDIYLYQWVNNNGTPAIPLGILLLGASEPIPTT